MGIASLITYEHTVSKTFSATGDKKLNLTWGARGARAAQRAQAVAHGALRILRAACDLVQRLVRLLPVLCYGSIYPILSKTLNIIQAACAGSARLVWGQR